MISRSTRPIIKTAQRLGSLAAAPNRYFPETIVSTLPSGFRVASENTGMQTATVGVWIDAGSRYENEKNNGTAHFLEHMSFKGTGKRSRYDLELEVENIGAHLNAYTSREQTVYYAKCMKKDLEQSVEILSDILLNSIHSKRDIEAERGVILREMEEIEQNHQEVVFDNLHTGCFDGNPLSMTILGPTKNIKSINANDLRNYIDTHYRSGRMVLASAGGVDHDELTRLAEKYFGKLALGDSSTNFIPAKYTPCAISLQVDDMKFCYGTIVVEGVSWTHEDNISLMVANTLLGEFDRSRGFGVSAPTRLAIKVSSNGGVQSYQAFTTCYNDTGLMGIYFGVQEEAINDLVNAIIDEWRWLALEVDDASVERGKKTLLTNLLLMLDGTTPICEDIGRQLLCYGRRIPIPELEARINAVTVESLRSACHRRFLQGRISTTVKDIIIPRSCVIYREPRKRRISNARPASGDRSWLSPATFIPSAVTAALARRTSQLSVTPSVGTAQTVLQVNPPGVRRTITSSTTQQSVKEQTLIEKFRSAYKRFQLKRLFPLFFILIYMFIGALLFWMIESGEDERRATETFKKYKLEKDLFWKRIDEIMFEHKNTKEGLITHIRKRETIKAIDYFHKAVDFKPKAGYGWDFMSSMYFAGTLFTTIGYGDIACVTALGRIATVIYSLVGIPLMLITLNELGKFLYSNITGCVKSIDNAYLGILGIFKRSTPPDEVDMVERGGEGGVPEVSSLASELGSQRDMQDFDDDPKSRMSVKVAVGITFGWIFFCAALFKLWEDWTYGESIYFMYISLSTIGLGDLSVARRDMMVLCFVFVIVGLSLVSMCINVVQVALEDFYCQLMMKLIMEYQQKLAEGGGELGASAGMLKLWGNNKAAKFLMPLLSKEAKKEAMVRVEVEAKKQGIEVPPILQDLDEKTGMPKLLQIVEDRENKDQPPPLLEELVQKVQLQQEALLPELFIAHEAQVQTDSIQSQSEYQQTEEKENIEGGTQTEDDTSIFYMEAETQTVEVKEVGHSAETQTSKLETFDKDTATVSVPTVDTEFQTDMVNTAEEEAQTWSAELSDAQTGTEIETKNVRIQTPSPVIEMKTVQTDNLELSRKSPSKMSSAKKKLRRAFAKPMKSSATPSPAMSEWKEVDEELEEVEEEQEEAELEHEEGSVESLHWDPVDGMHAEKQLPVSRLTELFNKNSQELRRRTSETEKPRYPMHRAPSQHSGSRRPSSFTKKNSVTASPSSSHRTRKVSE